MSVSPTIYYEKNRNIYSSQSECLHIKDADGYTAVDGYQHFYINKTTLIPRDNYLIIKNNILQNLLMNFSHYENVMDIGSSNGYFTYLASSMPYKNCYAVEHDKEYVDGIKYINDKYNFDKVKVFMAKFSNITDMTADVVLFLALIHWVYSCTELYGSIEEIIKKLSAITNRVLIIEWIDINDPAITAFKHTSFNKDIIKEKYTESNFIACLDRYFNSYFVLPSTCDTRKIYVVFKDFSDSITTFNSPIIVDDKKFFKIVPHKPADGGTSDMYVSTDGKYILKHYRDFLSDDVYAREVFWYETLKNEEFIPKLVYKEENKFIITEFFGKRLSRYNKPSNWKEQLLNILNVLYTKYGFQNNDMKPTEVLVNNNGVVGVVDFGWASLYGDLSCNIGLKTHEQLSPIPKYELTIIKPIIDMMERKLES